MIPTLSRFPTGTTVQIEVFVYEDDRPIQLVAEPGNRALVVGSTLETVYLRMGKKVFSMVPEVLGTPLLKLVA